MRYPHLCVYIHTMHHENGLERLRKGQGESYHHRSDSTYLLTIPYDNAEPINEIIRIVLRETRPSETHPSETPPISCETDE